VSASCPIWITGVGAATPLGHVYRQIADGLLAGRSGIQAVTGFDVSEHPSRIGGQVANVPCPPGWDEVAFRRLPRLEQLSLWCCSAALRDAGWWERRGELRLGVVLGIGAELLVNWEADALAGGKGVFQPERDSESVIRKTCQALELSGPAVSVSAACASGNYALAQARRWLRLGWVDVCLAGACDMAVTPMSLAGFGNLRALSRRNDHPQQASRPFDKERDGFVMGEGGAVFVLERAETARQRSARVYAEVAGCGASSDAHNMVIPSPDPEPATAAMRQALADARLNPGDVDYLNAHATSTPVGDVAEARVLEAVFGSALPRLPVSSTKSMTGHLLTAAAAVEALACLVAMERRALPPTINLEQPDPDCPLHHVANEAQSHAVRVAVSNSFGFGGSNTCLVLKAA
jgi:3-oxoacyl-[acyl-carrier-protein] synthase II